MIEILAELYQDITARNSVRKLDESLIGRAAFIERLTDAVDTLGFDYVFKVLANMAPIHGRVLTMTDAPSPGTISDPRR